MGSFMCFKRDVVQDAKPARPLCCLKIHQRRQGGCLHAALWSLFSSHCPQLTGWCNTQQDHSFTLHLPLFCCQSLLPSSPSFPLLLSLFPKENSHLCIFCKSIPCSFFALPFYFVSFSSLLNSLVPLFLLFLPLYHSLLSVLFFFFSVLEYAMSLQLIPSLKHLSNAR